MKNERSDNKDVEQLLKAKMSELSDTVDCFDKISARAFPKRSEAFFEDDCTVSDLENITGRPEGMRYLRWFAAAAAAVVCVTVIPKTEFARQIFYNFSDGSVNVKYQRIITEINDETRNGSYRIIDMPLDDYISSDVLVTPLFACPFERSDRDNANIRLYIRQIDGNDTTQVYAVEYLGTYSENNMIAAAESNYKFNYQDIEQIHSYTAMDISQYPVTNSEYVVCANFVSDDVGYLKDKDGKPVSAASFTDYTVTKDESGIVRYIASDMIYGHIMGTDSYFYDISTSAQDAEELKMPDRREMWRRSVYFNGEPAMAEESDSRFVHTEIFNNTAADIRADDNTELFSLNIGEYVLAENNIALFDQILDIKIAELIVPNYEQYLQTFKIYFTPCASDVYLKTSEEYISVDQQKQLEQTSLERLHEQTENALQREQAAIEEQLRQTEEEQLRLAEYERQQEQTYIEGHSEN